MMNMTTTPMSQLTFAWPEIETVTPATSPQVIPLGIAAPTTLHQRPSPIAASKIISAAPAKEVRRGRPEHISDLLLVVLDRYGISPEEFMDGLQ